VFLGSWDTVLELFIEGSQTLAVDADVNVEGHTAVETLAKGSQNVS